MKLQRIVVGMDFSEPSLQLSRWVARVFAPYAHISLVHAVNAPNPPAFMKSLFPHLQESVRTYCEGAHGRLEELAKSLAPADVSTRICDSGHIHDDLLAVSKDIEADMIAVGAHGEYTGMAKLLGSLPEKLARDAEVPVFVGRRLPAEAPRVIVCSIDDSAAARKALDWANTMAAAHGAHLVVLHVAPTWYSSVVSRVGSRAEGEAMQQQVEDGARTWLAEHMKSWDFGDVSVTSEVRSGAPDVEVLSCVTRHEADIVVVGTRGQNARPPVVGSLARFVLRNSPCSVVAVPA